MRAKFKDPTYFQSYIALNDEDIQFYKNGLQKGSINADRIDAVNRQLFTTSLHTVIAKYSAGFPVADLQSDLLEVIDLLKEGWQNKGSRIRFDNYVLMLWMISLGLLLEIKDSDFEKIVEVFDDSHQTDYLYDVIISFKLPNRIINPQVSYPKEYGYLVTFYETRDVVLLKKYLDNDWYKKMKQTYWYDNDKNRNDVFFGYWSFESAAFMKILGLEDTILQSQQYYPYDLLHWNS